MRLFFSLFMMVCMALPFSSTVLADTNKIIPTISIISVVPDTSVTIMTYNFPPNEHFTVRMGHFGGYALDGMIVATTDSGAGGTFQATYTIPDSLKGQGLIAIRLDNPTGYFYSYSWFTNRADLIPTYTPYGNNSYYWNYSYNANYTYPYNYYSYNYPNPAPTFTVTSVVRDSTVTIQASNFPANEKYIVRLGTLTNQAAYGYVAGTTDSGTGGSFEATYSIPDPLKGLDKIAIRLDSTAGYYYSYNWFYNNTTR